MKHWETTSLGRSIRILWSLCRHFPQLPNLICHSCPSNPNKRTSPVVNSQGRRTLISQLSNNSGGTRLPRVVSRRLRSQQLPATTHGNCQTCPNLRIMLNKSSLILRRSNQPSTTDVHPHQSLRPSEISKKNSLRIRTLLNTNYRSLSLRSTKYWMFARLTKLAPIAPLPSNPRWKRISQTMDSNQWPGPLLREEWHLLLMSTNSTHTKLCWHSLAMATTVTIAISYQYSMNFASTLTSTFWETSSGTWRPW